MKNIVKTTLLVVTVIVVAIASCSAIKLGNDIKFSDVPETFWAYDTIIEMTQDGLFKGTTEPVNGVGTFSPEKTMSRAEFITVVLRAIYPEEMENIQKGSEIWWKNFYDFAIEKDLVKPTELDNGDLDKPMSREEMAMVLVRAVEKNGEKLDRLVEILTIADYDTIGSYYKDYVRCCFSFGLLCGVDEMGTFAPTKSLTRAEGAEVLCRLLKKDKRVKVKFSFADVSYDYDVPANPWENGGKKPNEYTWEEFESLIVAQQEMFFEWFETAEAFDKWMNNAQNGTLEKDLPWENGGKKPNKYTWEEFESLTVAQQEMFFEWFETAEAFDEWMSDAQNSAVEGDLPWEKGGKKPNKYTLEEFEALTVAQQGMFFEWFETAEAFDEWMNDAQNNAEERDLPWENGGKKPDKYTWEEFEALAAAQQEMFFEWFVTAEAFDEWMNDAQNSEVESDLPWNNGGKKPDEYTQAEFETLDGIQQEKFIEWFKSAEDFEKWMSESN